jgi:hypothetical protein
VDPDQVVNRRMHNLLLWGERETDPVKVVSRLAAMQAQEFGPAKWSVAQRCTGVGEEQIERLFSEGEILRIHILRPTWHFVSARDIRWMLELSAPRVHTINRYMYRRLGIDEEMTAKCTRLLTEALRGGERLTRREIGKWLARTGVQAAGMRLAYILMWAELEALICSGARRGKQHTYALLEERAPNAGTKATDDALAELTRRYFTTRGPATVKDYTKWSGLTIAQARAGLEMVESELERTESDGRVYWMSPETVPDPPIGPVIDLVQGYDEVVSSYGESRDIILGKVPLPGTDRDPPLLHTVLSAGKVAGHWKETVNRREVSVDTFMYRPLAPEEQTALREAVNRLGYFFGLPARLA